MPGGVAAVHGQRDGGGPSPLAIVGGHGRCGRQQARATTAAIPNGRPQVRCLTD
jgi:hypothetical protein